MTKIFDVELIIEIRLNVMTSVKIIPSYDYVIHINQKNSKGSGGFLNK